MTKGADRNWRVAIFWRPGNNYVTHSIAEMMNTVRSKPGKGLGYCQWQLRD